MKTAPFLKLTNVKTADDMLGYVEQVLAAEPASYNQDIILCSTDLNDISETRSRGCGTVGCVAGHVAFAVDGMFNRANALTRAAEILGITSSQSYELFQSNALQPFFTSFAPTWGTPSYAEAGIKHIRRFRERYASQLKRTFIPKPLSQQARDVVFAITLLTHDADVQGEPQKTISKLKIQSLARIPQASLRRTLGEIKKHLPGWLAPAVGDRSKLVVRL